MRICKKCNQAWILGLAVVTSLIAHSEAITKQDLYTYGVEHEDRRLQVGDDISSSEVQLVVPISFYERLHTSLYVSVAFPLSLPKR